MIWVLLAIGVVLIVGCAIFGCFVDDWESCPGILSIIGIILGTIILLASLITGIVLGVKLTGQNALEEKIEICIEENTKVEQDIDSLVKNYLKYETEVYEQFKNESSTVLIQLFPELKGNELVIRQLEVIQENNKQIKDLRSQKANLSHIRWWLTFRYN